MAFLKDLGLGWQESHPLLLRPKTNKELAKEKKEALKSHKKYAKYMMILKRYITAVIPSASGYLEQEMTEISL